MMEEFIPIGSRRYLALVALLLWSRGMDFFSTWVATPNLVLEGNPIAKRLGWKWGIPLNLLLCVGFAFWPLPAIIISTTSALVAARNFQSAWLMRSMGEDAYRDWHVDRLVEAKIGLLLVCLAGQTFLTASVGAALTAFSPLETVPWAIGVGMIAYSAAVGVYTALAIWRIRRAPTLVAGLPRPDVAPWPPPSLAIPIQTVTALSVNEVGPVADEEIARKKS